MNRDTLLALAVAALGVLLVGIAATTLEDRRQEEQAGGPSGEGDGGGAPEQPVPEIYETTEIPYVAEALMVLLGIFLIIGIVYMAIHYRKTFHLFLMLAGIAIFVSLLLRYGTFDYPLGMLDDAPENMSPIGGEGGGEGTDPEGDFRWEPIVAILGLFGLAILAAVVISAGRSGTGITPSASHRREEDDADPSDTRMQTEIGEAAGRAADRIEDAEGYQNEVYRAWSEMTALLDLPNTESATPGDFAREAIERGMRKEDVRDLTRLFEQVRYGNRPATEEREEAAVSLLRRIEERYAEDP